MTHTPLHKRELPSGYTLDYDASIWNVGQVFTWSEVFKNWLIGPIITVKPNDTLPEAYKRSQKKDLPRDTEIFFVKN